MSKSKVDQLVDHIVKNRETMKAEDRCRVKEVFSSVPLDKKSALKISCLNDVDFSPIAQEQLNKRYDSAYNALYDAVNYGNVNNVHDLYTWFGLNEEDYDINDLIDYCHAYSYLGETGRPETMSGFLG